ncbi:hypothetical protein TNCV_3167561 [Trichonephila clavipes]|uniref:Uncharacterized protein n=1 Tax=Trichonephila clavipes TaxID=2585209 RepID=A0A8X6RB95_TRICX|nr:hypothetical protein TNCV_3167561 [Trichonephila clavipes]
MSIISCVNFELDWKIRFLFHPSPQRRGYFNDYSTFDNRLFNCAIEVEEIVDLSEEMNSDSDADIVDEIPIKTVKFFDALHCLETVKTYLMQQDKYLVGRYLLCMTVGSKESQEKSLSQKKKQESNYAQDITDMEYRRIHPMSVEQHYASSAEIIAFVDTRVKQ